MPQVTSGRYQPLSVGTTWVYNVTDTGVAYTKNSQVMPFEDIGGMAAGTMGYKVSETIKTSTQFTWYESTDTDVRRHHDQEVTPAVTCRRRTGTRPTTCASTNRRITSRPAPPGP